MSAAVALLTEEQLASLLEQAAERGAAKALALRSVPPPELVSGAEMCRQLGVSRSTLHRFRQQGAPAVPVGDVFRYRPDRMFAWLETRKGAQT